MAGLPAILSGTGDEAWHRCGDGALLQPLDLAHLLFPNEGRENPQENFCFNPRPFRVPPLLQLLPAKSGLFVPEELLDGAACLLLATLVVGFAIILTKHVWNHLDSNFAAILPPHKQWYVVANMYKAFLLAVLTLSWRYWQGVYMAYWQDRFMNLALKRSMMIYVSTDVASLFLVPKLPTSTVLHHIVTVAICLIDAGIDLSQQGWEGTLGVAKMSILYGVFSSVAFLVNAYLGLRVVYPKARWMSLLVVLSLVTYVLICAPNWTVHVLWLASVLYNLDLTVATVAYIVAIAIMAHDDVVLIKWLMRKSSPMAADKEPSRG